MSEESDVSYEEDEVIWAKVRGYPWWPAFVDRVHASQNGEVEYTVLFFGDTTYSRLEASKIKKFCEYYADFYPVAKTNRKLMSSIQMAEEKLSQNNEDVEVFQEIRQELKMEGRGRRKYSRNSLGKEQSEEIRLPPKNSVLLQYIEKSVATSEGRPTRSSTAKVEILDKCKQFCKNKDNSKQGTTLPRQKQRKQNSSSKKHLGSSSEEEIQSSRQPNKKQLKLSKQGRKRGRPPKKQVKQSQQESQEQESDKKSIKKHSPQQNFDERKTRKALKLEVKASSSSSSQSLPKPAPRKRGRPKRIAPLVEELPTVSIKKPTHVPTSQPIIQRTPSPPRRLSEPISTTLSQEDFLIVQQTRKLINRREELVQHLVNAGITTSNVQEVLQLGVASILEEGERTKKVEDVLTMLRTTLIHKFFPNDALPRKKQDKIKRKRHVSVANKQENQKQKIEERQQSIIRKKTISKLQKFLRNNHPSSEAKQKSIKIQSYFYQADSTIQQKYRKIAFNVLCSLKEGKESAEQVIKKVEAQAYD